MSGDVADERAKSTRASGRSAQDEHRRERADQCCQDRPDENDAHRDRERCRWPGRQCRPLGRLAR